MLENSVVHFSMSDDAVAAFERENPLPPDVLRIGGHQQSAIPPALVEILLEPLIWAAVGGVSWIAKRVAAPIDEFSKAFASEAGKDLYQSLKKFISDYRAANSQAAELAERLERARIAAEQAEKRPVGLSLGITLSDDRRVYVVASEPFSREDATVFLLSMHEVIAQSAEDMRRDIDGLLGHFTAHLSVFGFELQWVDQNKGQMQRPYLLDGTPLSEPTLRPAPSQDEIAQMRERLLNGLPPEKRNAAIAAWAKQDDEHHRA